MAPDRPVLPIYLLQVQMFPTEMFVHCDVPDLPGTIQPEKAHILPTQGEVGVVSGRSLHPGKQTFQNTKQRNDKGICTN